MKKYAFRMILLLSLIFNAAVVTMVLRVHYIFSSIDRLDFRIEFAADQLDLDRIQREELRRISHAYQERLNISAPARGQAAAELVRISLEPANDLTRAPEFVAALQAIEVELADTRREYILEMLKLLRPEQRAELFAFLGKPPAHMHGAPLGPVLYLLPAREIEGFNFPFGKISGHSN